MAIRVVIEINILLPLKWVLIINRDDEFPTFLSYENLFEVCLYCRRRLVKNCGYDMEDLEVSWFLMNKKFEDELNVLPPSVKDYLIICFLQPASSKEVGLGDESRMGL
ncbi:hypothetical protein ACFX15_012776 [Malus domestica]